MRLRRSAELCAYLWALSLCGCSSVSEPERSAPPAVTLRFRPAQGSSFREHWVFDLAVPGDGIARTALSFVDTVGRLDPTSVSVRRVVNRQLLRRDGEPQAVPRFAGVVLNSAFGADRSQLEGVSIESANPEVVGALRAALAAGGFGMLVEYPDQAVRVGDSWSIEPRTLPIGPLLQATLRPSYTLQSIEKHGEQRIALISSDIQVDLVRQAISSEVAIEGGGTASGTLRVRVSDGLLLESRSVLHVGQQVMVQGDVLGYREFSATSHAFVTPLKSQPNLASEPLKLEAADADEQRECAGLLASTAERVGRAPAPTRLSVEGALHADLMPTAKSALPLRDPGASLVLSEDPKRVEFEGALLDGKDLPKALRAAHGLPIYLYAPATLPLERLRSLLPLLRGAAPLRLVVRAAKDESPPKAPLWVEEQLHLALAAAKPADRHERLRALLAHHLLLCDAARDDLQRAAQSGGQAYAELPSRIVHDFVRCGCTTTNLDGLEATLSAIYGSSDLGYLRVPRRLEEGKLPSGGTLAQLASALSERQSGARD